ncbi:hypothetical protein C8J57DRAFT_1506150 [Mycena rebaudengoi]|nr:hypothetical protein C8J57DRAFT_1506150 [Mycena rebaudengoi]
MSPSTSPVRPKYQFASRVTRAPTRSARLLVRITPQSYNPPLKYSPPRALLSILLQFSRADATDEGSPHAWSGVPSVDRVLTWTRRVARTENLQLQ